MNTARSKLGTNVFDPHADLRPSAKKLFGVPGSTSNKDQTVVAPPAEQLGTVATEVPLNPVVTEQEPLAQTSAKSIQAPRGSVQRKAKETKVRFGANIPPVLKEEVDNAAFWIPGMTVSKLVENALEAELRRLKKEHNNGQPFEERGEFRFGRPRISKS